MPRTFTITFTEDELVKMFHVENTIRAMHKVSLLPSSRYYYKTLHQLLHKKLTPIVKDLIISQGKGV